jgi:hypothetical protein
MPLRAFIAALALLIGGALLWVITAGSDEPSSAQRATSAQEKQAVQLERQLSKDPTDQVLLAAAMRAWIGAGAERLITIDTRSGEPIPDAVTEDYEAGLQAWNRYLKQTDGEASAEMAEMAGATFFQLVEIGSTDPRAVTANAAGAVRAEKIACKHEPNLLSLSELAAFQYFNGEYAAGDKAGKRAARYVVKSRRKAVFIQLNSAQERGEKFVARVKRGLKTLEETGEEELDTPIKGYGWAAGINGYEPGTEPS